MHFRDYENNIISIDDIITNILVPSEYKIFIGTDSQIKRKDKKVIYASCIVLYHIGKGGKIYTSKHKSSIPNSLKERLTNEVWRSLEVAMSLKNKNIEIIIHVDANKSTKHKSGFFQQELASMVESQGYKCETKPNAFAASSVADRFVKKEVL
jgi:predicted RNase H-related nuclease YkuK (DUF458 family)